MDFLKGTEAEAKAPEVVEEVKPKPAKKAAKVVEPTPAEVDDLPFTDEPDADVNPFELADYQECKVSHRMKPRINPETLDKEWYPEFEVEKKIRVTTIQHSHAETLNSQSANSNLRYYLIKK